MKLAYTLPTLLLLPSLAAQTVNVLPSSAATTNPAGYNSTLFYSTSSMTVAREGRTQVLYAASDVQNSGVFQAMQLRRPASLGNANPATTVNLRIDMSMSPVNHLAASTSYAANHGANVVNVFNGNVNLPAEANSPWPIAWQPPIPFSTPFPFIAAAATSFCVEFQSTQITSTTPWYVEASTADTGAGTRVTNLSGSVCPHSGGVSNSSISHRNPQVGGDFYVYHSNLPGNNPSWNTGVVALGFQGVGGTFGGLPLPILLSSIGLTPTTPNCQLANDIVVTIPATYVTGSSANNGSLRMPNIPIPNDPTLAGASYFTQAIALDINPTTMIPGLFTSWSSRWTIGSGIRTGLPLTQVTRTGANATATGTVATYTGPTMQIIL